MNRLTTALRSLAFALVVAHRAATAAVGAEFHAAPEGKPSGDGTRRAPWDLATALAASDRVRPGDTLWLHAGTYRGGFECKLAGTAESPVTIRQAPGERATIDCRPRDEHDSGLFQAAGDHSVFWGFEVTCSDPKRETAEGGSWPADIRRGGMFCRASQVRFINLIVHDTGGGFGFWSEGEGGEVYGCLVYHNGWKGPDRGHGHAIYAQNRTGSKRLVDNILFRQFSHGIHCYGSEKAFLRGFHIEGNVAFQNGLLTGPNDLAPSIFVGGGCPVERLTVVENYTYAGPLRCGYPWGVDNGELAMRDNYVVGGLSIRDFKRITFKGNTVVNPSGVVRLEASNGLDTSRFTWDHNHYFRTGREYQPFELLDATNSSGLEWEQWQTTTRLDAASDFNQAKPRDARIAVRPNRYEPGRAHVVLYNWAGAESVEIDLRTVLTAGQKYRIVSAQDFFGEPVVAGKFSGEGVRLPLRATAAERPVGMPDFEPPATEPEFGVYVVLPEA